MADRGATVEGPNRGSSRLGEAFAPVTDYIVSDISHDGAQSPAGQERAVLPTSARYTRRFAIRGP